MASLTGTYDEAGNSHRIGKALELLKDGLSRFVIDLLKRAHQDRWQSVARQSLPEWQKSRIGGLNLDVQSLTHILLDRNQAAFSGVITSDHRNLLHEIRAIRNRHAHQETFDDRSVSRALDTIELLLSAIGLSEAERVAEMRIPAIAAVKIAGAAASATPAVVTLDPFPAGPDDTRRGVRLFQYLSQQVSRNAAVGISYASFFAYVHGKSTFAEVAGRNFLPSDSGLVVHLALKVTAIAGSRIEVKRAGHSIKTGMDTYIWSSQKPHDRPAKAWNNPKYQLPYSYAEWAAIFPANARRLITAQELHALA